MRRRSLLGTTLLPLIAGCSTITETNESAEPITLKRIDVSNVDDQSHQVHLQLYADGERVFEDTYAAEGDGGGTQINREWPMSVERYTLRGRKENNEWREFTFDTERVDTDCAVVGFHIFSGGRTDIQFSTAEYNC